MEGDDCAGDTDECASSPCQNGGQCGESGSYGHVATGSYSCVCDSHFYGENCETSQDECNALPKQPYDPAWGGNPPDSSIAMTCLPASQMCVDCAKVTAAKMGKPARPNPECPNGYTCQPCPDGGCPPPPPPGGGH